MIKRIFIFLLLVTSVSYVYADSWYVREDGGTREQCTGQTDAAYPGSGENKACAVKHIFELLDPRDSSVHIDGGDTIYIANGSYEMGRHAEYDRGRCHINWAYDCTMPALPSGTSGKMTKILGEGWDGSCSAPPELWGSGRAAKIINLDKTSWVELNCLDITDHSSCVHNHRDLALRCDRNKPYNKPFADKGIYFVDGSNYKFSNLKIHGLMSGIHAGRISDGVLDNVELVANSVVGWDGDVGANNSNNSGTLVFRNGKINYNGCGEKYNPGSRDHMQPHGCLGQTAGGYGDGLGTHATGGDWLFEDMQVMYNVSDGIDLLYHRLGGNIIFRRVHAEGNAGNQLKTTGNAYFENNIIIGNCDWHTGPSPADFFGSIPINPLGQYVDKCRALGNTVSANLQKDTEVVVLNNTIYSGGDCAFLFAEDSRGGAIKVVNNILYLAHDAHQLKFDNACAQYTDGPDIPDFEWHHNIIYQAKPGGNPCGLSTQGVDLCSTAASFDEPNSDKPSNPKFAGFDRYAFNLSSLPKPERFALTKGSPAIDIGYTVGSQVSRYNIPSTDYFGRTQVGGKKDIGALEYLAKKSPPGSPPLKIK